MSDHLPECPIPQHPENAVCFCPALRACEQRERQRSVLLIADAYAAGVQAARDAVADCRVPWPTVTGDLVNEGIADALAAIDGLKEET